SEDGFVITSDPGVGIRKSGWGYPRSTPEVATCAKPVNVRIVSSSKLLAVGQSATIQAVGSLVQPEPGCPAVSGTFVWGNSNTSVVSGADGSTGSSVSIQGVAPGTSTLTVTYSVDTTSDTASVDVNVLGLEIFEVVTPSDTATPPGDNSFVAPNDVITVRARVSGAPELNTQIRWEVTALGDHTGPPTPPNLNGTDTLNLTASSLVRFTGGRDVRVDGRTTPNPPLEYDVIASLIIGGTTLEDRVPPLSPIRQDERDRIRQEYVDYNTVFRPARNKINIPQRVRLNTGNYTQASVGIDLIAEETPGNLDTLLANVQANVNSLLNNDNQRIPVGTQNLPPTEVVVEPGDPILRVGPLGDTDPQGDDICAGPLVNGACAGPILAGANGTAETQANNRNTSIDLEQIISSAYRNPQRNFDVGSKTVNSRHTRGRALDSDPRGLNVPGKTSQHLMCIVEHAGDNAVGASNSFTERGPATFLNCDDSQADHVHIQN
ncbi:MAG: hypothetical protein ACE5JU_22070, partial [Candidatus Binatia bacterium]